MWKKFLAGALSGLLSSGLANPSDLLKIRMQGTPPGESYPLNWHVRDVYFNHGGFMGFYAGVPTTVLRAIILNSAYLGSYDPCKYFLINISLIIAISRSIYPSNSSSIDALDPLISFLFRL